MFQILLNNGQGAFLSVNPRMIDILKKANIVRNQKVAGVTFLVLHFSAIV